MSRSVQKIKKLFFFQNYLHPILTLVHVFIYLEQASRNLYIATVKCETKLVEHLLARGVDIDFPYGNFNRTPLYEAAINNDTYTMQLLLDGGADINKRDDLNQTPLHVAVYKNSISAVRLLLSRGAEPSARDVKNETSLDLALRKNHREAIRLLMAAIRVQKKNNFGIGQ